MGPNKLKLWKTVIPTALILAVGRQVCATPTTDDCAAGTGCIRTPDGKTGTFQFFANYDIDTHTFQGQVTYADANFNVSSSTLTDYADPEGQGGYRILTFALNNPNYPDYNEIRIVVDDVGGITDDSFEIQLQGSPYYAVSGNLLADCGTGIAISQDCNTGTTGGSTGSTTSGSSNGGTTGSPGGETTGRTTGETTGNTTGSTTGNTTGSTTGSTTGNTTGNTTGDCPCATTGGGGTTGGGNPPPSECDDFVTGGGWIVGTPSGAKANFGVRGGNRHGLWGGLNYLDHSTRMHVKSTGVTGYSKLSDVGRQINYNVTINGESGTAVVKVYDNGEPGRDDTFSIQLSNGYSASGSLGGSRPGGGNLQLHKGKCDNGNPGDQADCTTDGKPDKLTLTYTGGSCDSAHNSQPPVKKYNCSDLNGRLGAGPARIVVSSSSSVPTSSSQKFLDTTVQNGSSFDVTGSFGANTYFFIYQGGVLKQMVQMHTSCSAPLIRGETFGGLKLTDYAKTGITGSGGKDKDKVENGDHGDSQKDDKDKGKFVCPHTPACKSQAECDRKKAYGKRK
jgi:hypothetical protein